MKPPKLLSFVALVAFATAVASAQEPAKWTNLDDGLKAARKSARPVLVVTTWRSGICNGCDTWFDRVPRDAEVQRQFPRFEQVEWQYDGLKGKVIAWTRENGGKNADPSVQAFVVAPDTGKVTRAAPEQTFAPVEFAKWLKEQADAYERAHPSTRVPFALAEIRTIVAGTTRTWSCPALDAARKEGRPALVYVTRGERGGEDKTLRAQAAASRKLEKGLLDSEQVAKAVEGFTLVKLDLADPDHLGYAKSLDADKAPALLLFVPGEILPQTLDLTSTPDVVAFKLRKVVKR